MLPSGAANPGNLAPHTESAQPAGAGEAAETTMELSELLPLGATVVDAIRENEDGGADEEDHSSLDVPDPRAFLALQAQVAYLSNQMAIRGMATSTPSSPRSSLSKRPRLDLEASRAALLSIVTAMGVNEVRALEQRLRTFFSTDLPTARSEILASELASRTLLQLHGLLSAPSPLRSPGETFGLVSLFIGLFLDRLSRGSSAFPLNTLFALVSRWLPPFFVTVVALWPHPERTAWRSRWRTPSPGQAARLSPRRWLVRTVIARGRGHV